MGILRLTRAKRVTTESDRQKALAVMRATYQREKGWVHDVEPMFPREDLARGDLSWFIATRRNQPMGVLRVLYDPPVDQYQKYGLTPIDGTLADYDFMKSERLAEVGRFAVIQERRRGLRPHAGGDARDRLPRLYAARDRCFRERFAQPVPVPHTHHWLPACGNA